MSLLHIQHTSEAVTKNDYDSALSELTLALENVLEERVVQAIASNQLSQAMVLAETFMTRCPHTAKAFRYGGDISFKRLNYNRAIELYTRYLELDPDADVPQLVVARRKRSRKADPFMRLPNSILEHIFGYIPESRLEAVLVCKLWTTKLRRLHALWSSFTLNLCNKRLSSYFEATSRRYLGPHIKHLTLKTNKHLCPAMSLLVLGECTRIETITVQDSSIYKDEKETKRNAPPWSNAVDLVTLGTCMTRLHIMTTFVAPNALLLLLSTCPRLKSLIYLIEEKSAPKNVARLNRARSPLCSELAPLDCSALQVPERVDIEHLEWVYLDDVLNHAAWLIRACIKMRCLRVRGSGEHRSNKFGDQLAHFISQVQEKWPALERLLFPRSRGVAETLWGYDERQKAKQEVLQAHGLCELAVTYYEPKAPEFKALHTCLLRHQQTLEYLNFSSWCYVRHLDAPEPKCLFTNQQAIPLLPRLETLVLGDSISYMQRLDTFIADTCHNVRRIYLYDLTIDESVIDALLQLPYLTTLHIDDCNGKGQDLEARFIRGIVAQGDSCTLAELEITPDPFDRFWGMQHFPETAKFKTLKRLAYGGMRIHMDEALERRFVENATESGLINTLDCLRVGFDLYTPVYLWKAFRPGVVVNVGLTLDDLKSNKSPITTDDDDDTDSESSWE
ncbi:hypothetical protein BCR43DRAFT_489690 [Syncephalastrum racemosum]|uniref:Uncharacterized protein n=1 Tax=Syncephalastrum racemosum TaxID=13706 RepID=A0A1X2HEP5_SYNRA|nr:hypothetical protein BCR43DRAFT_489690 [Syncephalastrum racemosum]